MQFYDKRGNVIQVRSNNQLNTGLDDSRTMVPDFTGKARQVKTVQAAASSSTTVLSTFSYDHSGRLKSLDDSYNGAAAIRIAYYEYNELGQVVDKKLHSTSSGSSYLQSVDYRYNIRGQLTSINNSSLTADDRNDDTNDVFGMEILYDQQESAIGNSPYYNGMISAVKWKAKDPQGGSPKERSYRFDYDNLQRLKNALYQERPSGGSWGNAGAYDEKNISYDENGNILSLQRNAYISGTITTMDNLSYSYEGNRLSSLSDGGSSTLGVKNLTGSAAPYSYDQSGSLTGDPRKGTTLSYNILGRTEKVTITTSTGRYINYTYDATGTLIRKQQYDNNNLQKTTDYIAGFVYENGALSYFGMAEGRVRNTGSSLKSEYMIKDYQGNVRVSFEEQNGQAVVRQENSYYPYGLVMPGGSQPTQPNRNLYNGGSEWQNDYGDLPDYYQTYYRNYDAALGRFLGVDPVAEASESVSPYHYSGNNPVMYNDPLGDKKLEALPPHSPSGWGAGTGLSQEVLELAWTYWSMTPDNSEETYPDPASGFKWSPWAGERISQEEWLARGGDPKLLATAVNPQFYSGGWVKKETVTSTKTTPVNANGAANSGGSTLDPSTLGRNLFGNNYTGGNNPRNYDGTYNYTAPAMTLTDYPSIGHDRRYDRLGAAGPNAVLTDTRAILIDARFVGEQFGIALDPRSDNVSRAESLIAGMGILFYAMPKTAHQSMTNPGGWASSLAWYFYSNIGVNNIPSKR